MTNRLLYLFAALGLMVVGAWVFNAFFKKESTKEIAEASVLLERVHEVLQLVTIKGDFQEVYYDKNIKEVTLYLPIPTQWEFSKEALLEVTGTVLVGYDMDQVSITVDSLNKQIRLSNLPQPTILAVDHQIKYRNLEESFFNSFAPEDFTKLNKNAKEQLIAKAKQSGLLEKASLQGNTLLNSIEFMAQSIGWTVVYAWKPEEAPQLKN